MREFQVGDKVRYRVSFFPSSFAGTITSPFWFAQQGAVGVITAVRRVDDVGLTYDVKALDGITAYGANAEILELLENV